MSTIRDRIIDAIVARLAIIRTANGYATNAGASVHLVRSNVAASDCPCVVVWPQVEDAEQDYGDVVVTMPILLNAIAEHGATNAASVIEDLLGDLIEAMTGRTWAMPYTSGSDEIEVGDTITGATSGTTAYVQAVTLATGTWAGGDAAGTLTLRRLSGSFSAENLKVGAATNVATTTGVMTATTAIAATAGGLAQNIYYAGGGAENYPEDDDTVATCGATFHIVYRTKTGNPFNQ